MAPIIYQIAYNFCATAQWAGLGPLNADLIEENQTRINWLAQWLCLSCSSVLIHYIEYVP